MSAIEDVPDLFFAGALIYKRDEKGDVVPTWRYRVGPFQEAFRTSGLTYTQVDARAGWEDRFARVVGLRPWPTGRRNKNGEKYPPNIASTLSYANAVRIARALDLDFVVWEL